MFGNMCKNTETKKQIHVIFRLSPSEQLCSLMLFISSNFQTLSLKPQNISQKPPPKPVRNLPKNLPNIFCTNFEQKSEILDIANAFLSRNLIHRSKISNASVQRPNIMKHYLRTFIFCSCFFLGRFLARFWARFLTMFLTRFLLPYFWPVCKLKKAKESKKQFEEENYLKAAIYNFKTQWETPRSELRAQGPSEARPTHTAEGFGHALSQSSRQDKSVAKPSKTINKNRKAIKQIEQRNTYKQQLRNHTETRTTIKQLQHNFKQTQQIYKQLQTCKTLQNNLQQQNCKEHIFALERGPDQVGIRHLLIGSIH